MWAVITEPYVSASEAAVFPRNLGVFAPADSSVMTVTDEEEENSGNVTQKTTDKFNIEFGDFDRDFQISFVVTG